MRSLGPGDVERQNVVDEDTRDLALVLPRSTPFHKWATASSNENFSILYARSGPAMSSHRSRLRW